MKTLFGLRCPGCGKPVAFALGQPDGFRCDACGTTGGHPPEVAHQLREADGILRRTDTKARQFSGIQRFALKASGALLWAYVLVFAIAMLPAGCSAGCAVVQSVGGTPAGMLMMGVPPLILFPSGIFGLFILVRTRRRLREATAAIPPATPNAPARCRVCGGPLESTSDQVIVRCGYCAADCVVTKGVLDGLRGNLRLTSDHVVDVVRRSATAVGSGIGGLVVYPLAVLVVPVASFLCIASTFAFYVDQREDPPDLTVRYVVEAVPPVGLECIGVIEGDRIGFGFYPHEVDGARTHTRELGAAPAPAGEPVTAFVGRTVHTDYVQQGLRSTTWTVTGAYHPPLHDGNVLRLRDDAQASREITVELGRAMVCFPRAEGVPSRWHSSAHPPAEPREAHSHRAVRAASDVAPEPRARPLRCRGA